MNQYVTPEGYGDTFYIYGFVPDENGIVNGKSVSLAGVVIQDADFIMRAWAGADLVLTRTTPLAATDGTIQLYDGVKVAIFQQPILSNGIFPPGMAILPERRYKDNSAIRFDLANVKLAVNVNGGNQVYADQLAFYGVKRTPGGPSDPGPSKYRYYEKPYSYPFTVSINSYGVGGGVATSGLAAAINSTILVTDFDFELRRITLNQISPTNDGIPGHPSPFKIMLYDATWRQRFNIPMLSELVCHNPNSVLASTAANGCWPSPPIMYPVNSVIRFDIYSLIVTGETLPQKFNLLFEGVRRIEC